MGLNGWGIYDYGWGIYDLNGWGIYGSNGWGSYFFQEMLINTGLQLIEQPCTALSKDWCGKDYPSNQVFWYCQKTRVFDEENEWTRPILHYLASPAQVTTTYQLCTSSKQGLNSIHLIPVQQRFGGMHFDSWSILECRFTCYIVLNLLYQHTLTRRFTPRPHSTSFTHTSTVSHQVVASITLLQVAVCSKFVPLG